ncbi:hypothetical protein CVT24_004802 [Panaeolus cyanescens]|uniref:Uncharacterized protein n=1 Tax=Panaeolus cyanescens TaxID=181874 RepID=A0A409WYH7_9AGAR|nr:hypothetical protein CVT24_004802 [Panaeolus cyanescens]
MAKAATIPLEDYQAVRLRLEEANAIIENLDATIQVLRARQKERERRLACLTSDTRRLRNYARKAKDRSKNQTILQHLVEVEAKIKERNEVIESLRDREFENRQCSMSLFEEKQKQLKRNIIKFDADGGVLTRQDITLQSAGQDRMLIIERGGKERLLFKYGPEVLELATESDEGSTIVLTNLTTGSHEISSTN